MALRSELRTSRRSLVLRMAGHVCVHRKYNIKCLSYRIVTRNSIKPGDNCDVITHSPCPSLPGVSFTGWGGEAALVRGRESQVLGWKVKT